MVSLSREAEISCNFVPGCHHRHRRHNHLHHAGSMLERLEVRCIDNLGPVDSLPLDSY